MKFLNILFIAGCLSLLLTQSTAYSVEEVPSANEKPANTIKSGVNVNVINRSYALGAGDTISILFNAPEFDMPNVKINPDGRISLKYFGSTKVDGYTVEDFEKLLRSKYMEYIKDPKPSVSIIERRAFVAFIFGCVLNPGLQEISDRQYQQSPLSIKPEVVIDRRSPYLSNLLLAAGGVTHDADIEHVKISNEADGTNFEVNLLELLDGDKHQDIFLMPGDVVFVPKLPNIIAIDPDKYQKIANATFSPKSVPIRVFGYVNSPGLKQLDPSRSLNLNSAIAAAGGYTINSPYPTKYVIISRVDRSGRVVTNKVNPMKNDIALLPNDIVYVPEKPRQVVGKAFDYAARMITPVSMFASGYNNWALMFDPRRYTTVIAP